TPRRRRSFSGKWAGKPLVRKSLRRLDTIRADNRAARSTGANIRGRNAPAHLGPAHAIDEKRALGILPRAPARQTGASRVLHGRGGPAAPARRSPAGFQGTWPRWPGGGQRIAPACSAGRSPAHTGRRSVGN